MNYTELVTVLSGETGSTKVETKAFLDSLVNVVTATLKNGDDVALKGLGTIKHSTRPAREGRNPATGEAMMISAKKVASFKASKTLKDALNS